MSLLARMVSELVDQLPHRSFARTVWHNVMGARQSAVRQVGLGMEELEARDVPTLLGQQLFPSDNAWNQNIANAPVAANSASVIAHIGATVKVHPDLGYDSPSNGSAPIYGIPFNVANSSTPLVNVSVVGYPSQSDIEPMPIPANAVIEGDYQNGPNLNGPGYNSGQRGDSHLIVWDESTNTAYELFGASRPSDNNNTTGGWTAIQETVWNMNTDEFRQLGATSADAAGLSILAGLLRPDEALPVSQGGQGAIDHALRMTLPQSDINPQYIYPASHQIYTSQESYNLPLGARLRLENTQAIDALIAKMGPEAQAAAIAMQQYGLIVADAGSAMFVTGSSASVNASNQIDSTWDISDILGLESLTASDFQVLNLTPIVTGLSTSSAAPGSTVTITGQNFSGAAGKLSVYFGSTASSSVTVVSDTEVTAVVPSGTGTVNITVQSGVDETDTISSNPNANVTAPVFGYGVSATSSADLFTFGSSQTVSPGSLVSFADPTVTSGGTDIVTFVVVDTTGKPIASLPSSDFSLSLSGGTSTGTFSAVTQTSTAGTYTATFTAGTSGTASELIAKIEGVQLTEEPQVTVEPDTISPGNSTVTFATSSVSSAWTDYVTIAVKDTNGNPVAGLPASDFSLSLTGNGTSTGSFGPVSQTATAGTYTSTFTGIKAGTATSLVVVVNGVQLTAEPTVTVIPGSVSVANSTVSFANSSVASSGTDSVTLVIEDSNKNPISGLAGSSFSLGLSNGTSTGTFSSVSSTSTPGAYTTTFTGVKAGTASELTATVSSVQLTSNPEVTVTPGAISASNSTASFANSSVASTGTDVVTLVIEDANGNAVTGLAGAAFSLSLSGGTSTGTFGTVAPTSTPGTYTSTFTGVKAGTASQLVVTVSGAQLTSEPKVTVAPGTVSASSSSASFASSAVTSGGTDLITFVIEDSNGNAIAGLASSAFSLKLSGGTSTGAFGAVSQTSTPGAYTSTFTGELNGSASTLTATISGVQINSAPQVTVNPGAVSATNSSATLASSTVVSGGTDSVTITVKDANGNAIAGLASSAFTLSLSGGTSTGSFGAVTPTATSGVYTATLTGVTAGSASELTVSVSGVQLSSNPQVTVTSGSISASNSTANFANSSVTSSGADLLTLVIKDINGNPVAGLTSSAFSFSLSSGTSTGAFGTVTQTSTPGTYTSAFTGLKAGTASTLTATVGSVQLAAQPQVSVTAGAISASNSSATVASSSVNSGTGDLVTLVVEDSNGNPVAGLSSSAFSLSLSGGTSTGTFGSVTATSTPGTYTSTLTGVKAGTASEVSAMVNSVVLASHPAVNVVPGAVGSSDSSVTVASPNVTSGGTDAIDFMIEDLNGNPITGLTNSDFSLGLSGGTSTGTLSAVTAAATPGAYTSMFTGMRAGSPSEMTWSINSTQLASEPQVTVAPGSVSAGNTSASLASPTVVSGGTDLITFVVEDTNGNAIAGLPSSAFSLSLSGTSTGAFGAVTQSSTPGTYTTTFTGMLAGTASPLKAIVDGVQISAQPQLTVLPGSMSTANSSASFASSTVAAGNTDLVTIELKDANGNAITGLSNSDFSPTLSGGQSAGSFGAVAATTTPGSYTAEFTAGAAGTSSTLQVLVDGAALSSDPKVTVERGPASGATSSVTFGSPTVVSGATDAVAIQVLDAGGNPITGLASSAFVFKLSGGTTTGAFSAVKASATPGAYTATFTGALAGTPSPLSLTVSGVALLNKPTVQVTPGALNAGKSVVSVAASTLASGSSDTVTITLKDADGNVITTVPTSGLSLAFTGGKSTATFGTVTQMASGAYTVPLTGVLAGAASKVSVAASGVSLTGEPSVTVVHGPVSGSMSSYTLPATTVVAGKTETIAITVADAAGNPISGLASNPKNFAFTLTGGTSAGTFSGLKASSTAGVYSVVFKGVTAGTAGSLSVAVEAVEITTDPQVQVIPGALSTGKSVVSVAASALASGSSDTVTIALKDADGNVITTVPTSGLSLAFTGGKSTATFGTITETTPGIYTVPLTGVLAGAASKVSVKVDGVTLTSEPSVTVEHGPVSSSMSKLTLPAATVAVGKSETITITVTDAAGNPISGLASDAANFVFALVGGTSAGTFSGLKASSTAGVYTVVFTGVTAGTPGTLSVEVDGIELSSAPQLQVT